MAEPTILLLMLQYEYPCVAAEQLVKENAGNVYGDSFVRNAGCDREVSSAYRASTILRTDPSGPMPAQNTRPKQ